MSESTGAEPKGRRSRNARRKKKLNSASRACPKEQLSRNDKQEFSCSKKEERCYKDQEVVSPDQSHKNDTETIFASVSCLKEQLSGNNKQDLYGDQKGKSRNKDQEVLSPNQNLKNGTKINSASSSSVVKVICPHVQCLINYEQDLSGSQKEERQSKCQDVHADQSLNNDMKMNLCMGARPKVQLSKNAKRKMKKKLAKLTCPKEPCFVNDKLDLSGSQEEKIHIKDQVVSQDQSLGNKAKTTSLTGARPKEHHSRNGIQDGFATGIINDVQDGSATGLSQDEKEWSEDQDPDFPDTENDKKIAAFFKELMEYSVSSQKNSKTPNSERLRMKVINFIIEQCLENENLLTKLKNLKTEHKKKDEHILRQNKALQSAITRSEYIMQFCEKKIEEWASDRKQLVDSQSDAEKSLRKFDEFSKELKVKIEKGNRKEDHVVNMLRKAYRDVQILTEENKKLRQTYREEKEEHEKKMTEYKKALLKLAIENGRIDFRNSVLAIENSRLDLENSELRKKLQEIDNQNEKEGKEEHEKKLTEYKKKLLKLAIENGRIDLENSVLAIKNDSLDLENSELRKKLQEIDNKNEKVTEEGAVSDQFTEEVKQKEEDIKRTGERSIE